VNKPMGSYFKEEAAKAEELKKQDELRRKRELSEFRNVSDSKEGRAVLFRIMKIGRPFDGVYEPNSNAYYFKGGQRSVSLQVMSDLLAASPENYQLMMKENGGEQ
jgi:hypothetical protein